MAHATYNASNGNFQGTQGVTANNDYVVYNNTQTGLFVQITHDSDAAGGTFDVTLSPAEGQVFRAATGGTATFTGTPTHTDVNASVAAQHTNNNGDTLATGSASLVLTPF